MWCRRRRDAQYLGHQPPSRLLLVTQLADLHNKESALLLPRDPCVELRRVSAHWRARFRACMVFSDASDPRFDDRRHPLTAARPTRSGVTMDVEHLDELLSMYGPRGAQAGRFESYYDGRRYRKSRCADSSSTFAKSHGAMSDNRSRSTAVRPLWPRAGVARGEKGENGPHHRDRRGQLGKAYRVNGGLYCGQQQRGRKLSCAALAAIYSFSHTAAGTPGCGGRRSGQSSANLKVSSALSANCSMKARWRQVRARTRTSWAYPAPRRITAKHHPGDGWRSKISA